MRHLSRSTFVLFALLSGHCAGASRVTPSDPPAVPAAVVVAVDVPASAPDVASAAPVVVEVEVDAGPAVEVDAGTPPCLSLAEAVPIIDATPNLGPRRRADWRYTGLRCSGPWAALLSSPRVRGTTDAMHIVFRFQEARWRAVTWGSSVADEVPIERRSVLGP